MKDSRCSEEHPTALDNKTMRNIEYLSEFYRFSKDIISHLIPLYGDEVESCLWVLKRPSSRYSVRINTIKIDPNEFVSALEEKGVEVERHPDPLPGERTLRAEPSSDLLQDRHVIARPRDLPPSSVCIVRHSDSSSPAICAN